MQLTIGEPAMRVLGHEQSYLGNTYFVDIGTVMLCTHPALLL